MWTVNEVRKIRDGYYLIGSGEAESVGYDIKVLVEVDENFNPVYPLTKYAVKAAINHKIMIEFSAPPSSTS